jgi:hypothetical protein
VAAPVVSRIDFPARDHRSAQNPCYNRRRMKQINHSRPESRQPGIAAVTLSNDALGRSLLEVRLFFCVFVPRLSGSAFDEALMK